MVTAQRGHRPRGVWVLDAAAMKLAATLHRMGHCVVLWLGPGVGKCLHETFPSVKPPFRNHNLQLTLQCWFQSVLCFSLHVGWELCWSGYKPNETFNPVFIRPRLLKIRCHLSCGAPVSRRFVVTHFWSWTVAVDRCEGKVKVLGLNVLCQTLKI